MIPKVRLTVEDDNEVEEQSQIINKKFIELIKSRQEISQIEKKQFSEQQVSIIYKRFQQLCPYNQMDYNQFRKGLGLLGRQQSFLSRIFYILDQDQDGYLAFQDYLTYLDTILNGSDLQKARFSWLLLTRGKGQLEFDDLVNIFQQISVVWNALTGQIITPKKKYIEQLFNIFDVDQDQLITFQDFQIYFDEHPNLFGWFEYLNNVQVAEHKIKEELSDIRRKLREKLNLDLNILDQLSYEQIKHRIKDQQIVMEKKLLNLTDKIKKTAQQQLIKNQQIISFSQKTTLQDSEFITSSKPHIDIQNSNEKSHITNTSFQDTVSLKSFFKYNHETNEYCSQMSRIKTRRQKQQKQTKINSGIQMMKQLQSMLDQVYKLMDCCHDYRALKCKEKKYSPTKLKQLQVKYNIVDKELKNQNKTNEKKKMTVYFGHQNWNVVLNIMVGLRKSVKSLYDLASHLKVKEQHFSQEHEFVLGNKTMMGKDSQVYKFIEKAPLIFERLRHMYGLSNQQYQRSVGPQSLLNQLFLGNLQALNEKCSTGKSGAFFYLTLDNKVFLKTITKDEYIFFEKILKGYYQHMHNYKNSLIVRVYGLYKLKVYVNKEKIKTIYFISMQNIFSNINKQNNLKIQQIYDLKGSLYGRTGQQNSQLKDNDWINKNKSIKLPKNIRQIFIDQVVIDSKFFKKNNINDYSMMIAMIPIKQNSSITENQSENVFKRFNGGVKSSQKDILYVISIIDFLTNFQTFKNMEYILKSTFLSKDVSCVPPAQYSKRFRDFILNSVSKQE